MSIFAKTRCAILATAFVMPMIGTSPASAFASLGLRATAPAAAIQVHDRWYGDEDYSGRHYIRRHHHDDVVDAPFTHVETGQRVIVDAPFAHVAVGPHGRHIVAPFVDLWVPR